MSFIPATLPQTAAQQTLVTISVDPPYLENLLECLAELGVPIDPTIDHGPLTKVRFLAPGAQEYRIRKALRLSGFTRINTRPV